MNFRKKENYIFFGSNKLPRKVQRCMEKSLSKQRNKKLDRVRTLYHTAAIFNVYLAKSSTI